MCGKASRLLWGFGPGSPPRFVNLCAGEIMRRRQKLPNLVCRSLGTVAWAPFSISERRSYDVEMTLLRDPAPRVERIVLAPLESGVAERQHHPALNALPL
jgi:hypothetical protein